ncbi:MAG: glycosyltransferase [Pigmentiphaga sp.]|uniref:glycosyltransferase n=1 Tax=Pigmentiphaga sp. TaxID=1977564 RepID=UPI0029AD7C4A|nr:glycosyltransferase [Pigmentiphaga sp.]MDX3904866.1 glycosyltransferase [Pigmentiphaga sp.]
MKEEVVVDRRGDPRGKGPLISWIVPVYNTENLLTQTLDSIASVADADIEVIIVDDGSTDSSAERIAEWTGRVQLPVVCIRQANAGLSAARMTGLRHARGKFIGFCDSDDLVEMPCYLRMAEMALRENCDVAICRSIVFDGVSQEYHDFYDAWLWDLALNGQGALVTSALREPRLYRLEPNANTRLLRRDFVLEKNLSFPLGLHFEDFPTHVEALAVAHKVLLVDSTGYFYRVNRPGKITDQKSEKRFDILKSVQLAFDAAKKHHVDTAGRAYVAIMAARMTYWCGKHTLNKDRARFFAAACAQFKANVDDAAARYAMAHGIDRREAILLSALRANAVRFLTAHSAGRRTVRVWVLKLLFSWRHGRKLRRTMVRAGLQKTRFILGRTLLAGQHAK